MSLASGCERKEPLAPDALLIRQRLVLWWFALTVMGVIWSWIATAYLVHASTYAAAFIVCYLVYIWGPGRHAAESMSWEPRLRRWSIWKYMADYFQARLIKTADLDPSGNYLFAMVPHGICSCTGWVHFCTEATGFSNTFPGIDVRPLTLDANFRAPLIREYCLLHGLRSVGHQSIRNILTYGPGASVLVVPGGATESLLAAPGTCDVILARRKGFVRLALETGASLVPVVAFGENDILQTFIAVPGSTQDRLLKMLKRTFSFATPIFWGVNVLGGWGILPRSLPLNTVVGKPIALPKYTRGAAVPPEAEKMFLGAEGSDQSAATAYNAARATGHSSTGLKLVAEGILPPSLSSSCISQEQLLMGGGGAEKRHAAAGQPQKQQPQEQQQQVTRTATKPSGYYPKLLLHQHSDSSSCPHGNHHRPADPVLDALVDKYHAEFMAAVQQLWDEYKDTYAPHRIRELRFV